MRPIGGNLKPENLIDPHWGCKWCRSKGIETCWTPLEFQFKFELLSIVTNLVMEVVKEKESVSLFINYIFIQHNDPHSFRSLPRPRPHWKLYNFWETNISPLLVLSVSCRHILHVFVFLIHCFSRPNLQSWNIWVTVQVWHPIYLGEFSCVLLSIIFGTDLAGIISVIQQTCSQESKVNGKYVSLSAQHRDLYDELTILN